MSAGDRSITARAAAVGLTMLPAVAPDRLRALLEAFPDPAEALAAARSGTAARAFTAPDAGTRRALRAWANVHIDLDALARIVTIRGTRVWLDGDCDFPIRVPVEHQPAVLLGEGARPDVLDRPRVAIVGTRAATPHGLADAHDVASFLARAGCTIVSGLAIGIDAAAHEGALQAGGAAVGVIGTGLDIVYPRRHTSLFDRVRTAGVLVTEYPYGAPPEPWRFPERNRIIAALADAIVVIEATLTGGACITARLGVDYERPVFALPGSRRNVAAAGCNQLLGEEGVSPLLDPSDVLARLQLDAGGRLEAWEPSRELRPGRDGASVLHALGGEPATVDQLLDRTRLPAERLGPALRELERLQRVEIRRGRYWPR
jgi:DNA processing protein